MKRDPCCNVDCPDCFSCQNGQCVIFEVLATATTNTVVEAADVIRIIAKISMSPSAYANLGSSNILIY